MGKRWVAQSVTASRRDFVPFGFLATGATGAMAPKIHSGIDANAPSDC
jgi:hypothetical protein